MAHLEYCSNCGEKNIFGMIEGQNRFHCESCKKIHYENPKPTATLICVKESKLLLVKRAVEPAKGQWGLPGGFIELGETPSEGAIRELKEETNLDGKPIRLVGHCSHHNTIFGDVLLLGIEMKIVNWSKMKAGDDAAEAQLFNLLDLPSLAFICHDKIVELYKST
ncbi:MAG: NUDIX hydrolase [Candidatus Marinimicrobia bacterium]|jgi:ADP-ribose pyrophosphatase YjhB (NUDIX family)|nr:NUDIX hydrolase [Candidatus Neomarinimicrobiota bacterium]MBT5955233.1 NUDIX hydrolase [Candidatus Neomarinimicrobiota bacterium]MBT6870154.1 NUDIX hydrolase [Candidatus Neomarinimicrobiota bacterium]MBT7377838.1 NUDIX hydrolase [Candidatus Neomarinimicrobiota bacterium]|tara:strand:- start:306 stop:800 length:495 start_codon:yes stop_codon:yes gene_type:complete